MKPLKRLAKLNTKECLWIYILKILSEKPMHAYVIRNEVYKNFGFKPGKVTAYKVLYLLKKSGYVKKEIKGRKRVYYVTEKGRKLLFETTVFYQRIVDALEKPSQVSTSDK